jgi:hypothetical protein
MRTVANAAAIATGTGEFAKRRLRRTIMEAQRELIALERREA